MNRHIKDSRATSNSVDFDGVTEKLIPSNSMELKRPSMNQLIPNGFWRLFKANLSSSREGKIVLVQHRDIQDTAYSGSFIIKVYHSKKVLTREGWQHQKIVLEPKSNQPEFEKLFFDPSQSEDLQVLDEFVTNL